MTKSLFYQFLNFPELLDDRSLTEIEKILDEYPYFQSARLLHIKNLHNQGSISYDRELKRTALWVTDRSKLFFLLDHRVLLPLDDELSKTESEFSNGATIDFSALTDVTDFEWLTPEDKKAAEQNDELSQLIMSGSAQAAPFFNVDDKIDLEDFVKTFKKKKTSEITTDETTISKEDRRKNLIDSFIIDQPRIVQRDDFDADKYKTPVQPEQTEPDMITDTLAKIYINQGKYEKAISAYEKLSLKYPEKNIYFAGQIKKIKELINNQ